MATSKTPTPPLASLESPDRFDVTVGELGFVVRRSPNREWGVTNLVNRRYHIVAYAISGQAQYRCGGESFVVGKGQMLWFPKGLPHSGCSDPSAPWSFFSVTFDLHYLDPQAEATLAALPNRATPGSAVELQTLFSELERLWVGREPGYLLRCRSIILQLLHVYVRACCASGPTMPHVRRIMPIVALLQTNPARDYSVEDLAEMAELSPSRFRVLFKEYTGQSVVRYQNLLRINKAKDLLLSGEYTVTEAAVEVGIVDVYYFSRLFKKLTGFNPSYYRNQ
jgi:AraC-like DNA-binding protein